MRARVWVGYGVLASAVFGATAKCAARATAGPPTVIYTASAEGQGHTDSFRTGVEWSVAYTFDCTKVFQGVLGTGNFILSEDGLVRILVNKLAPSGSGIVYRSVDAGTHFLDVNSECDYTLTVTNNDHQ